MKARELIVIAVLAALTPLESQDADALIPRDFLVPSSLFKETATGKQIDPRERFAAEGIPLGEKESIAYDPVASRLFVLASGETLHRMRKFLDAEMRKGSARVTLTYGVLETREPLLSDKAAEKSSLVSTRVLSTTEQVGALLEKARGVRPVTVLPSPSITARSGETTEAWIGNTLTRNVPVISPDVSTVEMTLTLFQGSPGSDLEIVGETKVAIPSGGSVALEEWLGENSWRTRMITVFVIDSTGQRIPRSDTMALPGDHGWGPSGALFPGPVPEPAIEKVKNIIIPSIEFKDTPLLEAIVVLNEASVEHDKSLPKSHRGVNIRFSYSGGTVTDQTRVTLRLSNIPLDMAIKYTAEAAGYDFRIEGGTVLIGSFASPAPGGAADIWYAAFLRQQEADALEKVGRTIEAASRRQQSMKLFEVLREKFPDFKPEVIGERIKLLKKKLGVE